MTDLPAWPALMRRQLAAQYCDLSVAAFEREVAAGRFPQPCDTAGGERWYKAQLDKALAVIAGEEEADWRIGHPLFDRNSKAA